MVSDRSRFPTSRPGTQCRAGRQNTRNDKDLNRSRPQAFPDRAGNAQTQQRRDFPGFPVSPLYRERVSIGNAHLPRLPWLAGHGDDAPARRHGSFLAGFVYGGRERGAFLASDCKPRFAGFAVCTRRPRPAPKANRVILKPMGQRQRLLPHFPYAQKITASDRYYPHLIASRNHIGEIEACAQ